MKTILSILLCFGFFSSCKNTDNGYVIKAINDSTVSRQKYIDSFYFYSKIHSDFCDLSSGYFNKAQCFYDCNRLDSYRVYVSKFKMLNDTISSLSKKAYYYFYKIYPKDTVITKEDKHKNCDCQ